MPVIGRVLGQFGRATATTRSGPCWLCVCGRLRALGVGLATVGFVGVLASVVVMFDLWYARWSWDRSEEHARIERQVEDALSGPAEPAVNAGPSPRAAGDGRATEATPQARLPVVQREGSRRVVVPMARPDDVAPSPTPLSSVVGGAEVAGARAPDAGPADTEAAEETGPARALSVPRLGLRTAIVDVAWEPPPFVAGQIGSTAALGEGNTVLVGHRGGRAGDAFARLLGARLGDEVVAVANGVEHRYVVSATRVLRADDITPIGPTETPRLTLMTCIGAWNPVTGDYSHRLWVIAEPPDVARETLAATIARAGQADVASSTTAEAARLRTDAALARAALSVLKARSPDRR